MSTQLCELAAMCLARAVTTVEAPDGGLLFACAEHAPAGSAVTA